MNKYKLNFYSWQKNSDPDVKKSTILLVSVGPITFPVKIQMSRTLFNSLISVLPESEIEKRMLLVGLPRLKTKLKYADVPTTSSGNIPLEENFTSDHYDLFMEEIPVQCHFQENTTVGLICHAASDRDNLKGKTTFAICAACNLPSDNLRCTKLHHPEVMGIATLTERKRQVISAFCDLKLKLIQPENCVPGINECWEQFVDNSEKIGKIPEDIAERVVDEFTYLNLGFRQAFGYSLLRLNDPRSISQILTPCYSQSEFTVKIASLSDLLNNFDLSNFEREIRSEIQGTLNRLQEFLIRRQVPLDEASIKMLKNIVSIRNSFPIHSGNKKFLLACQEMNIVYPPASWEEAWNTVLYYTWKSLRAIRVVLPSNY